MVLTHADEVDADGVGQDSLLDDVADDPGLTGGTAVGPQGHVPEGVDAEFELVGHGSPVVEAATFPGKGHVRVPVTAAGPARW